MATDSSLTKVKIGDKPVASRYRYGGYSTGLTYEMSKVEAKEIVDAKLGSYAKNQQPVNKDESPERGVVNSGKTTTEGKK